MTVLIYTLFINNHFYHINDNKKKIRECIILQATIALKYN